MYGMNTTNPKNVTVALSMHVPAFWQLLIDSLAEANRHSPINVSTSSYHNVLASLALPVTDLAAISKL